MIEIEQVSWSNIADEVLASNTNIHDIIQNIDDTLPELFMCSYYYGETIIKDGKFDYSGQFSDQLDYANTPLLFSLNKDITSTRRTINNRQKAYYLHSKGDLFGVRNFDNETNEHYQDLSLFTGSQSVFVDDKFSNFTYFERLNLHYNINLKIPESFQDHFDVFKHLSRTDPILKKWQSKVIVFTKKWRDKILTNEKYSPLLQYIKNREIERLGIISNALYDINRSNEWVSHNLKKYNFKPDIYLMDTIEQLALLIKQKTLGVRPVISEESFPLKRMKEILESIYLKKSWVVFLHLANISSLNIKPIYFSLGNLFLAMRDEEQHKIKSNLAEIKLIKYIFERLLLEDTNNMFNGYQLNYYHSGLKKTEEGVMHPKDISNDTELTLLYQNLHNTFKSSFWRGTAQISSVPASSTYISEQPNAILEDMLALSNS